MGEPARFEPEADTRRAIPLLALLASLLLLALHEGIRDEAAWIAPPLHRLLLGTLATAPVLLLAFTAQRLADGRLWSAVLAYTALITGMGIYTGHALAPGVIAQWPVVVPHVLVLLFTLPVLAAFLAVWLQREGLQYPLLFEAAWRQFSAAAQGFAFFGVFWLLLSLWGALFKAIDIDFFAELFAKPRFIYPVSGLVLGFGLVIARSRAALSDTVYLRVLALWRGLLPLACALAITFAVALLFTGVEPLWRTRHATALLLALIAVLVLFSNAAFGKGEEPPPRLLLRRLTEAALLLLPVFAGLAAWALALRIRQYGISVDRLWAGYFVTVAALYALGYAAAVLSRRPVWLAGIAPVNRVVAILAVAGALATQTGLMDFRAITAHAMRTRAATLKDEDLVYLRWELGAPGVRVLQKLQAQRPSDFGAELLASKSESDQWRQEQTAREGSSSKARIPMQRAPGTPEPPAALLALLEKQAQWDDDKGDERWLLAVELDQKPPQEWLRLRFSNNHNGQCERMRYELFSSCAAGYCAAGSDGECLSSAEREALHAALAAGRWQPQPAARLDLKIGDTLLKTSQLRP